MLTTEQSEEDSPAGRRGTLQYLWCATGARLLMSMENQRLSGINLPSWREKRCNYVLRDWFERKMALAARIGLKRAPRSKMTRLCPNLHSPAFSTVA